MIKRPIIGVLNKNIEENHFYMNDIMHCLNSNARKITSYKYVFFKSILDNLFNAKLDGDIYKLDFSFLSFTFSKIYWNLAAKYKVPQIINNKKSSFMVSVYEKIKSNPKNIVEKVDFDSLKDDIRSEYLNKTQNQITIDVLYALYDDFNRNIYGYNKTDKYIYFSKDGYMFLSNYKDALEKINIYAWIKWTENVLSKRNESVSNLSTKLDESPERTSLKRFKEELLKMVNSKICFYCGKKLTSKGIHLDHFVPWSFIKDNQLWNFVLSCSSCNESKSDRIPSKFYLDKLIERNNRIFGSLYKLNLEKSYEAALHNGFKKWNW